MVPLVVTVWIVLGTSLWVFWFYCWPTMFSQRGEAYGEPYPVKLVVVLRVVNCQQCGY